MTAQGPAATLRRALRLLALSATALVACLAARLVTSLVSSTGTPTGWDWGAWGGLPGAGFASWAGIGVVAVAWGARIDRATAVGCAAGAGAAAGLANLLAGYPAPAVAFGFVAAAAEALAGGLLVERWLNRWAEPAASVGVVSAAAVAAVAVSTPLALAGLAAESTAAIDDLALGWSVSHLAAIVVIGAVLVPAPSPRRSEDDPGWSPGRAVELAAQVATLALLGWVAFVATVDLPLGLLPAIALVWGAWRFGTRMTSGQLIALAVLATMSTAHGRGPFADTPADMASIASSAYLVTAAVLCLLLAIAGEQRRRDVAATDQHPADRGAAERMLSGLPLPDVHDPSNAERALRRRTLHDSLTGLPNLTLLTEHVTHALAARERSGGELALLYCDCDGFKQINDAAGHAAGDDLLAGMAGRLLRAVRASDSIARLGGDEFAVLCTDMDTPGSAEVVATRLLSTFAMPFELQGITLHPTVSIGVSVAGPDATAESLLREAGTAMHAAKRDGRGRFATYEHGLQVKAIRRLTVGSQLRRALRDGELRVFYQPIVSIAGERVVAVEALVRWDHPEQGLLAPQAFLDVAEETDLVCEIDAWVASRATRDAVKWPQQGGSDIDLHLNFSARHLANHDAPGLVSGCLRQSGLKASRLVVELPESSLVSLVDGGRVDADTIREAGVRLAADDFGTRYATMDQLVNLPLDMVKVDREFVVRLESDPRARAVVEAVATLGRSLRIPVVAEGVERTGQQVLLEAFGVPAYQGYLHAPPVDADTLSGMLAAKA